MTDIMSKEKRSALMSKIKGKNTKIELLLRALFRKKHLTGYTFQSGIRGRPDFVFKGKKIAIFCDGEFWHGKDFKKWGENVPPFWQKKVSDNMKRDQRNRNLLRKDGWRVLHFWGKQIIKNPDSVIRRIEEALSESVGRSDSH